MSRAEQPDEPQASAKPGPRHWRRLALAAPISILVHVLLLVVGRPDYRPVADHAVEFDVLAPSPGPPPPAIEEPAPPAPPAPEAEPEPEPEPELAPEPEPLADVVADAVGVPLRKWDPDGGPRLGPPDGGYPDAGPRVVARLGVDGGTGEGGICLHDVFQFTAEDPGWLLWVSLASFRETAYQRGLADTLGSFGLYKQMAGATGMDPQSEVEGFVVTADDVLDWKTFRVVATYDSGEERLRRRLERNRGDRRGFSWRQTAAGYEAAVPGSFRWHMVGSGRVLAVTHEPGSPSGQEAPSGKGAGAAPPPAPANPYADASAADAGSTSSDAPSAGSAPSPVGPAAPTFPDWPRQVACLTPPVEPPPSGAAVLPLTRLARAHLGPDSEGRWPVALLATTDPRAIGLGSGKQLPVPFSWAVARAVFGDPIRVEGTVRFGGTADQVTAMEREWRKLIAVAAQDRFLMLAGLGGIFKGLELEARGNEIRFALPMTEAQIQAALLFIQLQGEALERRLGPDAAGDEPPGPTS